ncbi:GNAT family N-acetyltransferase [Streptococcus sp. A27]|uniref:GNAT family N-acetyltransferase n=1 Tax=unclassified Streptococcus TaxID=2608887 RepID=UPI00374CE2CA
MIRQAQLQDIPALESLLEEILQFHHVGRPDIFRESGQKYSQADLTSMIGNPDQLIFVYETAGQVVGHLFCQIQEAQSQVLQPVKTLFIDDLCVSSQVRGQGIGKELYAFALSYAKESGCYNITLDVWADNTKSVAFYEQLELKPQKIRMEEVL